MAVSRNAAALALTTNTNPTMPKSWPFYETQAEATTMTDPTTTTANETPQPDGSDVTLKAALVADLFENVFNQLARIEDRLDTIFDVLTADEDEEIQLTLDDKDAKRESEQGKGLG